MALSSATRASCRRPSRRFFLLLVCFLTLLPTLALDQTDPPPDQILHQVRQILDRHYQSDLPGVQSIDPDGGIRAMPLMPDIFSKILLVLAIIFVMILLFNMFYRDGSLFGSAAGADGDGDGLVDFEKLSLPDPDALAAEGRYAEAIHALLLRSLALVSQRLNLTWPRSLTSREILRHHKLTDDSRAGLRQLIQRVEVHHFGGMAPAEADYRRSREIFDGLTGSLREERP